MKKVYVKLTGVKILSVVQVIIYIAALCCFIYACTWDALYENLRGSFFALCGGLIISALLVTPFKSVVKAAEYYIGIVKNEYEVFIGDKPEEDNPVQ